MRSSARRPVWADAIDGDWCARDGRHISIQGPKITTERGAHVAGLYSRHAFSYEISEPDRDAGKTLDMRLADPFTVRSRLRETPDAEIETWKRCDATS